jgi:hypothetical protein
MTEQAPFPKPSQSAGKLIFYGIVLVVGLALVRVIFTPFMVNSADAELQSDVPLAAYAPAETELEILQTSAGYKYGTPVVYAEVRNNSSRTVSLAQVDVSFKDANGGIVGTAVGVASNVGPGQVITIDCLAPDINPELAKDYSCRVIGY